MDGRDLRKFQDSEEIRKIMSKIVSGREGYETVIEKKQEIKQCECGHVLEGTEKFCPECGKKVEIKD